MGVEPIAPIVQRSAASSGIQARRRERTRRGSRAAPRCLPPAEAEGLEPSSERLATCFQDRLLIRPDDFPVETAGGKGANSPDRPACASESDQPPKLSSPVLSASRDARRPAGVRGTDRFSNLAGAGAARRRRAPPHCDRPTALCPSDQTMIRPAGGCRLALATPVVRTTWRAGEISAGRMAAAQRRAGPVFQPGPFDWPAGWGTWGKTRVVGPRYRRK